MDLQDYAVVIKLVCYELKINKADDTIIRNITQFCKKLNYTELSKKYDSVDDLHDFIAKSYVQSIAPKKEFDYNAYLHQDKSRKRMEGSGVKDQSIDVLTSWLSERMPTLSSKAMNIYIDTRFRNTSNQSPTKAIADFDFNLVPRLTTSTIGDGRIQARVMPSQVTYFKINKIVLPYPEDQRLRNFSSEMSLTFTGLRSNGIITSDDTYHFTFTYTPVNQQLVELIPVNKYCKFNPPLRVVDNISVRFNDPILPVDFAIDRLYPASFNYLSSDGRIVFNTSHGLNDGDVIIIMGLKTNNDAANANVLNAINNPKGIVVTRINATIIATGIDFTSIKSQDTSSLPLILFYSKTFRIPLEIGYQDVSEIE